jgi:peroxiredoxin
LERVLIVRDPVRPNVLRRIVTCHQLASNIVYPGRLDADVRAEITLARQTFDRVKEQADTRVLDTQARRIATHLRLQPKTEWRHVVLAAEKQIEYARRGEIIAVAAVEEPAPKWIVGRPAPDFLVEASPGNLQQLSNCRGRPLVIGVFLAGQPSGLEVLKTLDELHAFTNGSTTVIAADPTACQSDMNSRNYQRLRSVMLAQRKNSGVLMTMAGKIDSLADGPTPRFILIDERGIVRQIIEGFGPEVPELLKRFVESSGSHKPNASAGLNGKD